MPLTLPELKPVSKPGWFFFAFCHLVLIVMSSLTFSAVWWSVGFWDCVGEDYFYSIYLDDGFCFSNDGTLVDWHDEICVSWDDAQGYEDAADAYEGANGLTITAMVFLIFSFVAVVILLLLPSLLPEKAVPVIRYGSLALIAVSAFFMMLSLATASSTDLTDLDNAIYSSLSDICTSNGTIPNVGWVFALLVMLIAPCMGMCMWQPLNCCAGKKSDLTEALHEEKDEDSIRHSEK